MSQFALADNVKETTTTTLTGTVSLLGAFNTSSKTFVNGIGSTKLTAYKIDDGAGNWECRFGVITSGTPDTITNAGFISSSTGSAVSFGAGTKTVTCVPMSELFLTAAISPVLVETDIASATTTDLGSIQTLRARITGTTAITGFGASPNTLRWVRFAASLVLTYNGTSLITPSGADIQTAAGDVAVVASDGSGNWRVLQYLPAGGVLLNSFNGVNLAASYAQVAAVTLPPGKWRLSASVTVLTTVTATYMSMAISTTTASSAGSVDGITKIGAPINAAFVGSGAIPAADVTVSASTTYYLNVQGNGTGTAALAGHLRAERIT